MCQLMPQGDKDRNDQISVQRGPQRSLALYQNIHVTRSTIYVESFVVLWKSVQFG